MLLLNDPDTAAVHSRLAFEFVSDEARDLQRIDAAMEAARLELGEHPSVDEWEAAASVLLLQGDVPSP
jgi:hypothetical protein